MIIQSPSDVAFSIFGYPVYYYGIILAVAIFIGVYAAYLLYKKFYDNVLADKIFDMSPYVVIFGIIGARLYYCLVNYNYYFLEPLQLFNFRQGGLSVHGMIIAGLISLLFLSKHYKLDFLKVLDCFFCGASLGQSIGRWGNFFNSEAFGLPYDGFLKLYIPINHRPEKYVSYQYFHPTFLYESVLDFCIFIVLLFCFKRLSKHPGGIACVYLILYSIVRIFVENIRIDSVLNIGGIPVAQIVSAIIFVSAFIALPFVLKRHC